MKISFIKILNLKKLHPEWGMKLLATVHDEVILEVRESFVDEAMPLIKKSMESAVKLSVPVLADVKCGMSYAEAK